MTNGPSVERELDGQSKLARILDLLRRYPETDPDETNEITFYLKNGPILEVGLLSSIEDIQPRLQRFRADHSKAFSLRWKDYMIPALMLMAFIAVCVALSDIGIN